MGIETITGKKGMQFKNALFAAVVVSMVIITTGVIVGEWEQKYDSGLTYDLDEFEALDTLSGEAQIQKDRITPKDADPGTGDLEGKLFTGGYGILGRVFLPFRSVFNMLESVERRFGFPSFIAEGILTLMFFSLITAIIAVIFRLARPNA